MIVFNCENVGGDRLMALDLMWKRGMGMRLPHMVI